VDLEPVPDLVPYRFWLRVWRPPAVVNRLWAQVNNQ